MAFARPVIRASLCRHSIRYGAPTWRRYLHKEPVTDDVIAELAARPLHPLTLGDLVRSVYILEKTWFNEL